jgi:dolichol-phosphate mannosyltransferase
LIDIIIPVKNDNENILKLIPKLVKHLKYDFIISICYDPNDPILNNENEIKKIYAKTQFLKNPAQGPCEAIKYGLFQTSNDCKIVYPADDFLNISLINKMYEEFKLGADLVVASRFIKGGSMKGCPLLKSILVRAASFSLFYLSTIPVRDASNGFRLFSKNLITNCGIESTKGFSYSLELLVKADRYKYKIVELPAQWEERSVGQSNFKIGMWINSYLKWYFYGLANNFRK